MRQLKFEQLKPGKDIFGGSKMTYSPREARPIDSKMPMHLTLKAHKSVMRNPGIFHRVNQEVERQAKRCGVRLYQFANVGNHLHLIIRVKYRKLWASFIRALTGRIAQISLKLKGHQKSLGFWIGRPFTRIINGWGKAYRQAKDYVYLNELEAEHQLSREEARWLIKLRKIFADPT